MGKQQYGRKSGFKRGKSHKNNATSRGATKKQRTKDEIYSKPAQDTSDEEEVSEELSTVVSEGEVEGVEDTVYKEPSEYDNLLRKLGSGNESVANAYRRRSDEEEVSEELSTVVSEGEVEGVEDTVYKEPSEYDNLLRKLGSGNESVANAYRRRLREEEGRIDTDDGSDSGSEEPDDDGDDDDEDDDDEG